MPTTSDPPPEVVDAFRQRWARELAELRRDLDEHLDEVLAVERREDPEHPGRELMPPEVEDPGRRFSLAVVGHWPAGWPDPPLTVRHALDLMERDSETPADAAVYLTNCVCVFVAPDLQADVLEDPEVLNGWGWEAGWRWPGERGDQRADPRPSVREWAARYDQERPLRDWVERAAYALRTSDGDGDGWDRLRTSLRGPLPAWDFPFTVWDAVRWGRLRLKAAGGDEAPLYLNDEDPWLPHLAPDFRRRFRGPTGEPLSFRVYDLGLLAWAEWRRRPEGLAWQTMGRLLAEDPTVIHFRMASDALAEDGAYADDDGARRALAAKLTDELRRAADALKMTGEAPVWGSTPPGVNDGMLALDAAGADFLARFEDDGRKTAEALREKAAERWRDFTGDQGDLAGGPPLWRLWRLWLPDPGWVETNRAHPPSPFALALCAVLWRDVVRPEREKAARRFPGMPVPAGQLVLDLRGDLEVRSWDEEGRDVVGLVDLSSGVRIDTARLPLAVAERLLRGDLTDLRRLDLLRLLDLVLDRLTAEMERAPYDGHRVPKLELPTGKALARALGKPESGSAAAQAEGTLFALSGVQLPDPNGTLQRLLLSPERRAHGGGRKAAWLVVPGELLLPTFAARMPHSARRWRRVVPWPDELAPADWPRRWCDYADAAYLAFAVLLDWTLAAGRQHGRRWLEAPGVTVDDAWWDALIEQAHAEVLRGDRDNALAAWTEAGWGEVVDGLLRPGPELPRLQRALEGAAKGARQKARGRPRRKPKP